MSESPIESAANKLPESGGLTFWQKLRRRKIKNYLFLDKRLQFHVAFLLAAIGGVNAFYFSTLAYFYTQELTFRMSRFIPEYFLTDEIYRETLKLLITTIVFVGVFEIVLITLLGLFFSHRIAGPLFAMSQKLKTLARGEVPTEVRLRKNDLLTHFADELNIAFSRLQKQKQDIATALELSQKGDHTRCQELLKDVLTVDPPPSS